MIWIAYSIPFAFIVQTAIQAVHDHHQHLARVNADRRKICHQCTADLATTIAATPRLTGWRMALWRFAAATRWPLYYLRELCIFAGISSPEEPCTSCAYLEVTS
ncbi:hypothetical protein [Nonomuraea sp. NPDC050310]|uniref:hypothetical protein n=1 Tax=Nonomuraea sp. NPDC050310 TaxID=3154935 RepID=UPI0034057A3E